MDLTITEAHSQAQILAKIMARDGAEAAQAAFAAYCKDNEISHTGQRVLRKEFKLAAGITKPTTHPGKTRLDAAVESEQAAAKIAAASSELPPEVSIEPAPESEPEQAAQSEPTPADLEESYGRTEAQRLLKSQEDFCAALAEGIEPAVAEAIYGMVIRPRKARTGQRMIVPDVKDSKIDSPCRFCWDLYDEASKKANGIPDRQKCIAAAIESGVATGTSRTQYAQWSKARRPEWIAKGWLK